MILVSKGTCAPLPPFSKGREGSASVMHPHPGVPAHASRQLALQSTINQGKTVILQQR